jgi:hypothetical protein
MLAGQCARMRLGNKTKECSETVEDGLFYLIIHFFELMRP